MSDDVGVPVHDQRSLPPEAESEDEIGEREGGMQRQQIVLGDPAYYPRFGFSAAQARHLQAPFSGETFMALTLRPGTLDGVGRVVYPPAFDLVD